MEIKTNKTSPESHKDFEATPTHKSHKSILWLLRISGIKTQCGQLLYCSTLVPSLKPTQKCLAWISRVCDCKCLLNSKRTKQYAEDDERMQEQTLDSFCIFTRPTELCITSLPRQEVEDEYNCKWRLRNTASPEKNSRPLRNNNRR